MIKDDGDLRIFFDGTDRIPDSLLTLWIAEIAGGARGAAIDGKARAILRDFVLRHRLRQPQSEVTLGWIADWIDAVLDHQEPRAFLGLSPRPKNRPRDPWAPAAEVACWLLQAEARGYQPAEAASLAADVFAKDLKSIERYRREGKAMLEWVNPSAETWEHYFQTGEPPRPLPPVRNKKSAVPVPTRSGRK